MDSPREYWAHWAQSLRRYRLHELTASFLEAGAPLALIGAQAFYVSNGIFQSDSLTALASMLEQEEETRAFVSYLMEGQA